MEKVSILKEDDINRISKEIGRSCGKCTLCCKLLGIPELNKPPRMLCPHVKLGIGCGIYHDRPKSCRNFTCKWLVQSSIGDEWYPLESKIVLAFSGTPTELNFDIYVDDDGDWEIEPYYSQIIQWVQYGIENNLYKTIIHQHGEQILLKGSIAPSSSG